MWLESYDCFLQSELWFSRHSAKSKITFRIRSRTCVLKNSQFLILLKSLKMYEFRIPLLLRLPLKESSIDIRKSNQLARGIAVYVISAETYCRFQKQRPPFSKSSFFRSKIQTSIHLRAWKIQKRRLLKMPISKSATFSKFLPPMVVEKLSGD
jgi:hypothetical protein